MNAPPRGGLAVEELSHRFGARRAVDGVSLAVAPGEIVALVGPSGSGKSTVLRLAAGLETVQRGRVAIGGEEVAGPGGSLPPEARGVGLVFQDFALFPHLTVAGNVAFGLHRRPAARRRLIVRRALERVGLAGRAAAWPHTLSGGEQQRVALARALAPAPRAMLLDEPFSGLDTALRETLREETARILRESGTPTLIVTHDPEEAMLVADRIALMRAGRILQCGAPDHVYRAPADPFCATFLGAAQRFDGVVRGGRVATPLGPVAAPGLAEGTAAQALVRPEGVRLDAPDGEEGGPGVPATVRAVRGLGRAGLVALALDDGTAVRARVPWFAQPVAGAQVRLSIAPAMAFAFPAGDRRDGPGAMKFAVPARDR